MPYIFNEYNSTLPGKTYGELASMCRNVDVMDCPIEHIKGVKCPFYHVYHKSCIDIKSYDWRRLENQGIVSWVEEEEA